MKRIITSLAFLALLNSCTEEVTSKGLLLSGEVEGLNQGKLYFKHIQDTSVVTLDSIIIKGDSKFQVNLALTEPEMIYVLLDRGETQSLDNSLSFFAEPGTMTFKTSLEEFYAQVEVTGSKNQKVLEQFNEMNNKFKNQNLTLIQKNIENQIKRDIVLQDSIDKAAEMLKIRQYRFTANFTINKKDFEAAPYIALTQITDINTSYLDTIYSSLIPKVKKSKYGVELNRFINERKQNEE